MSSDVSQRWQEFGYAARLHDLEALIQVANQINRSLDPENVLATSLKGVQSVLAADYGCFVLLNPATTLAQLAHPENLPAALRARLEEFARHFSPRRDGAPPPQHFQIISELGHGLSAILHDAGVANSLSIPLLTRNRPIGILFYGLRQTKGLAPKSIDLLMSIGDQVAMAIENAWLHASLGESEKWHRAFIESSPDAIWEGDADAKTTFVNEAACQIFGYDRATLLTMRAQDLIVADQARGSAVLAALFKDGYVSNVQTTIRTGSGAIRSIGYTIRMTQDAQGKFAGYQTIFRDITAQTQVLENLRQRNAELAALNAIARLLDHPLEIAQALEQVCAQIGALAGVASAAIYVLDEAKCFKLLAQAGLAEPFLSQVRSRGLDASTTQQILASGEAFGLNDQTYPAPSFGEPRAEDYLTGISVPLRQRDQLVGGLLVSRKPHHALVPSDVALMQNIGAQISAALDHADLFARMQQQLRELDCLAQLSAACVSYFDVEKIAQAAVASTRRLLPITFCSVRLLEGTMMRLVASFTARHVTLPATRTLQDFVRPALTLQTPVRIDDVERAALSEELRDNFLLAETRAALFVPLVVQDCTIGVLVAGYSQPHVWQPHEVELAQTVANQVAGAINSAQLYQNVSSEQRKVQAIFDSGLSGLFATDAEGHIVMFNHAAERITGWTLAEIRGRLWQEIFGDPAHTPPVEPLINDALLRKKTIFAQEGRSIRTQDSRIIPVAKAVAPLLDAKGNVTGAVGAFWDLTRERTTEMERQEMVRFAAHQLRSPLTALLSALQLYARPTLSADRRAEMWNIITEQGERLRRFASQFLDFEAVVVAERALHLEPTPLTAAIRSLVNQFRADPGKHTFVIKSLKPEPRVLADPDHLQHILRNLLDNAVNYSPRGSRITIAVRLAAEHTVEVIVKDQGPGIPLAEQAKIFVPFYRSPNMTSRSVYSHGLGLAITRRLVKEMQGEIWIVSQVGKGAEFHFTLRRQL